MLRERGHAEHLDLAAREHARGHLDLRLIARMNAEGIGPHHARALEKRQHPHEVVFGSGAHENELGEARKLFGPGFSRVDRECTRREAMHQTTGQRAKVAGSLKHHDLVAVVLVVEGACRRKPANPSWASAGGGVTPS